MSNVHTNFHSINDKLYQYWYHYWGPVAFIGDARGMCHWNAFQNCTYEIVPNISGVNELRLSICSSNSRCRLVQHSPNVQQVMGSINLQLEYQFSFDFSHFIWTKSNIHWFSHSFCSKFNSQPISNSTDAHFIPVFTVVNFQPICN